MLSEIYNRINYINNSEEENLKLEITVLKFRNRLLELIPLINCSENIEDLYLLAEYMSELGIPFKDYITKFHIEEFNFYLSKLSFYSKKGEYILANLSKGQSIGNLSNILGISSTDKIEEILSIEQLEGLRENIETVIFSILKKVVFILSKNEAIFNGITDGLTKLLNKKSFDIYGEEEFKKAKENLKQNPFTLIILDIDRFKNINDQFGHPIGDLVLKEIAKILGTIAKKYNGKAFRIGGEEFSLILPKTDKRLAINIAKEISKNLGKINLRTKNTTSFYEITSSIGVSTFDTKGQYSKFGKMVKETDDKSYFSKRKGRCRIIGFMAVKEKKHEMNDKLILDMKEEQIDYSKIAQELVGKIEIFISTLIHQKQKLKKGEPISNLFTNDYRQVAYYLILLFNKNNYKSESWLEKPLNIFIGYNYIKPGEKGRFKDIYYLMKLGMDEHIQKTLLNKIENKSGEYINIIKRLFI